MEDSGGIPGGRGLKTTRDWTQGSILGSLLTLSWPMMVTQALTVLGPTLDMIWVGKLGAASIAGVGVSSMVFQFMSVARMGMQTGTRAIVSRAIGANDDAEANNAAQQTLVITIAFAVIMAAIGIFLSRSMLLLLGLEADVLAEGTAYLRIQLIGMITMSFQMMGQSLMQASGDSQTPMRIAIGSRILHAVLSPMLIFGWGIFPHLGVSGAALTGVFSQGVAGALSMWMLYGQGQRTRLRLTMRNFHFDWGMIWRIVKIGIPSMINGTERSSANLLVMWFVVPFGTAAVAAHALLDRLDRFLHMPAQGLGTGAGVLAGQNLGAGHPERAEKTGWLAAFLFTGAMALVSIWIWFWPESLIRIFNTEPDLMGIAVNFLRIQIVALMTFGFVQVMMQCLNGVGDTWIPMLNTLLTLWAIQMPLAYFLPKLSGLGVYGVRWAMVAAVVARAAVFALYFKTGRWKRRKV